jgi:hypothetical protein
MTDSSAPKRACPVCGQEPARLDDNGVCPACGRAPDSVDPLRLVDEALRRDAADGGWLVD